VIEFSAFLADWCDCFLLSTMSVFINFWTSGGFPFGEPEKPNAKAQRQASRPADHLLAHGAKLCDQVELCHRLWRVNSYGFHRAERLAQASGS
jgi:hypothetical protein